MNTYKILPIAAAFAITFSKANGQGNFVNLNFESANLPTIPSGQYGGEVPISLAMPGWTGYLGTQQTTQVLHNNFTLGDPSIDIYGPDSSYIIDGNYMAELQAGGDGVSVPATIEQTGLVPAGTQSLQIKFFTGSTGFSVTLGSMEVNMIPLSSSSLYTVYGANIASLAGQTEQLSISALPTAQDPFNGFFLDDIVFSPMAVPEPSTWSLMACGAGLLGVLSKPRKP
jgi:hypothetical protein